MPTPVAGCSRFVRTRALLGRRNAWPALGLALFAVVLFFDCLGDRELWSSHEARAAQNAQRFLDDGGWGLLRHFDDRPEVQKPPLYYWLVALAATGRGRVDAWAVRLPAALAGLGTVFAVYAFLAARGRPFAGGIAGIVLATAHHFTWITRSGRIDVPLALTTTLAVLLLWVGHDPERRGRAAGCLRVLAYLAIAAGVLLKGPLGLALPLVILGGAGTVSRWTDALPRRSVIPPSLAWGVPFVVAAVAPWFVAAHLQSGGEFTRVFFWYHHVQRAAGGAEALAAHPWWFYLPRLLVDGLPWSLAAPVAAWGWWKWRREDADARLGLAWLLAVTIALSLSRFKRADYLLPAYPGAAIWLGCVAERWLFRRRVEVMRPAWRFGIAVAAAAILAGWGTFHRVAVPHMDAARDNRAFAAAVRAVAPRPTQVLLFRVEDHLLAYHLGRPLNTFMEWENLNVWAGRAGTHFIVMPAECAEEWRLHVDAGDLAEVGRHRDRTDRRRPRDLVLMRTRPQSQPPAHEHAPRSAEDCP